MYTENSTTHLGLTIDVDIQYTCWQVDSSGYSINITANRLVRFVAFKGINTDEYILTKPTELFAKGVWVEYYSGVYNASGVIDVATDMPIGFYIDTGATVYTEGATSTEIYLGLTSGLQGNYWSNFSIDPTYIDAKITYKSYEFNKEYIITLS